MWILTAIARCDGRMDAAADVEVADHRHGLGMARTHEIIENLIDNRLVKSAFVAIRPKVEFKRLQLDAERRRNIADADCGEIRLARSRTDTSKLRAFHVDFIVSLRARVREGFQLFAGLSCHCACTLT
jgi:hypothetical protein